MADNNFLDEDMQRNIEEKLSKENFVDVGIDLVQYAVSKYDNESGKLI